MAPTFYLRCFFLLFATLSFAQDEGLLLNYEFNGDLTDSSINSWDAIAHGITYGPDRDGNTNAAVYFDGIDDYIELPNSSILKPDLPVSFSFWIKYDSDSHEDRAVFNTSFEDDRSSGVYFNTQISTGNYAINYGDGSPFYNPTSRRSYVSNTAIDTESWHFIVAVIESATNMRIYVDCNESGGSYSGTGGPLVYSTTPGNIGRRDRDLGVPALYFKGALDDFKYWDVALSNEDIINLCPDLSVPSNSKELSVKIFPNPAASKVHIVSNWLIDEIVVYNAAGQVVQTSVYTSTMDIGNLAPGIYHIGFIGNNGALTKKLVVE